jgi:hypothetical protein
MVTAYERYRCADIESFPVGNNSELIYSRINRSAKILPSNVAELLYSCRTFETLEDHARKRCHELQLDQKQIDLIRSQLSKLVGDGFLISYRYILDQLNRLVHTQNALNAIASIGWVTCNRVESLRCSMVSYIENCKQYGRMNDFVVMDGSESADIRNDYQQMLLSLKARYGVKIFYAGLEEKVRFANMLINRGLSPDVVNFALFDVEKCGHPIGANRNALLLHTIGDTIFSADDDTLCSIAPAPEFKDGLVFAFGVHPTENWFFADREVALRSVTFVREDILAIHEQLLGKEIGNCISMVGETAEVDFNQVDTSFFRRLEYDSGRVLVTFNGLIGDSGWGLPTHYLFLSGNSHKRLIQSEEDYRSAYISREIINVASRITISDNAFCMTYSVGFDNRALLPPFMPVKRAEDALFGSTLWNCFEDGYFGHLPWVLLHAPSKARSHSLDEIWRSAGILHMNNLIRMMVESYEFGSGKSDSKKKLRALGRYLTELGSMPLLDFEEFIRIQMWHKASSDISWIEHRLQVYEESPDFWANDVKKYLDTLCKALLKVTAPHDLMDGHSISETLDLTQRLVLRFGQLLYWWPEVVEAARNLRAQGLRLAQPI